MSINLNFNGFTIKSGNCVTIIRSCGSGRKEKTEYGKEEVAKINGKDDVELNETTVNGNVNVRDSLSADNATIGGNVNTRDSARFKSSKLIGSLNGRDSIRLTDSSVGCVSARDRLEVNSCVLGEITARNKMALNDSTVNGDVTVNMKSNVTKSQIKGTFTYASDLMVIENSEIKEVCVQAEFSGGMMMIIGNNSIMSGGSVSSLSYTGGRSEMTINGVPLSEIKRQAEAAKNNNTEDQEKEKVPKQVLKLVNTKVGSIEFEGGNGEVHLVGKSGVEGDIKGGVIAESSLVEIPQGDPFDGLVEPEEFPYPY